MRDLVTELIPHAPQLGLYVAPGIPDDKLRNALRDYGTALAPAEVLALFDATLMGSAKDGALVAADRLVFQNNDLEPIHEVRYADLVRIDSKRKLLGGTKVFLHVNRGRATFELALDFSGKPKAAPYVERFLREVMLHTAAREMDAPAPGGTVTDPGAVRQALDALVADGRLAPEDRDRMLGVLGGELRGGASGGRG